MTTREKIAHLKEELWHAEAVMSQMNSPQYEDDSFVRAAWRVKDLTDELLALLEPGEPVAKQVERVAIALDYMGVGPRNVLEAWKGRGAGGLNDRDMIWGLPSGHNLALSNRTKDDFRRAARKVLEEFRLSPPAVERGAEIESLLAENDLQEQIMLERGRKAQEREAEIESLREALEEIMVNYPPGSLAHLVAKRGLGQTAQDPYATQALEADDE